MKINTQVYPAVCPSIYLYGSESWITYARYLKDLGAWYIRCLQLMFNITWRDTLTHEWIYRRTGSTTLEFQLGTRQLRWIGHVIRMMSNRLPDRVFYGMFTSGMCRVCRQKKRHKHVIRTVLKSFEIAPKQLDSFADDRGERRSKRYGVSRKCEEKVNERMRLGREKRHSEQQDFSTPPEDGGFPCTVRVRVNCCHISLWSRLMVQQRKREEGAAVVAPDEPP